MTTIYDRVTKFIIKKDAESGGLWEKDMQSLADGLIEFSQTELSLPSPIVPEVVVEWEYIERTAYFIEQTAGRLNEMGKEGWELCATTSSHSGTSTYIFKRQK